MVRARVSLVMVVRIGRVQGGRTSAVPQDEVRDLWYGLGSAYSEAGGGGRRAWKLGFTVVCVVGALVLLSAPVFGTSWAGPFAAVFPIAAGLISGGGLFLRGRLRLRRRVGEIGRALAERGLEHGETRGLGWIRGEIARMAPGPGADAPPAMPSTPAGGANGGAQGGGAGGSRCPGGDGEGPEPGGGLLAAVVRLARSVVRHRDGVLATRGGGALDPVEMEDEAVS